MKTIHILPYLGIAGGRLAVAAALLVLIHAQCAAQGYIEGVNISYEHLPMKIEAPGGDQNFSGNNMKLTAAVPIFLREDRSRYLIVGGSLEAFNFSGTHPDFEPNSVYSISPTLGYSTRVGRDVSLTGLLVPPLNSDYKAIKASDINFGVIFRASWKASEAITWKAILGYRQQFYGPQYVVLLGMDWKVNDRWMVFGDVPHSLTISYAASPKVNAGFNLFVQNSTYRLENQNRYFEYNSVNPGLFIERYITDSWAVRATAAYTLIRNMEVYNSYDKAKGFIDFYEMGNRADPLNPEVSSGLSFKMSLSYRIVPGKHK
jgi:hypothetical protein